MKKVFLSLAVCMIAAATFAQVDEVTLTVLGTGVNEEQATLQALRSAIEQSFGTFVSANTTILNDKMVQDEIVSVSTGNIRKYDKLSVAALPNGNTSVLLKATVSINKLTTYARSKGSRAEFAGQTYAMNVKLLKLKAASSQKALEVLRDNVIALCNNVFDYDISLGEPVKKLVYYQDRSTKQTYQTNKYILPVKLSIYASNTTDKIYHLVEETRKALQMSDVSELKQNQIPYAYGIPVSGEVQNEIYNDIVRAIINDAYKSIKIKKIGESEYYYFRRIKDSGRLYSTRSLNEIVDGYLSRGRYMYSSEKDITTTRCFVVYSVENPYLCNGMPMTGGYDGEVLISRQIMLGIWHPSKDWSLWQIRKEVITTEKEVLRDMTPEEKKKYRWGTLHGVTIYRNGNDIKIQSIEKTTVEKVIQEKLLSKTFEIIMEDAELERFRGLELVGVHSPAK